MTTTAAGITATSQPQIQFVVAIEGYPYLLTDGQIYRADDAWSGNFDYTSTLGGLSIDWSHMQQSIAPWDTRINPMSISLSVMDIDGTDQFGIDTHATMTGFETKLSADANTTDVTISVLSTAAFASPTSVYLGQERIETTTATGLTFSCTRGMGAPFKAGSETLKRFGRNHKIPVYANVNEAKVPPAVTSTPRNWIGRWVGVWMHTVEADALNPIAEAQVMFAGTITSVSDTSNGRTVIEVTEARNRIQEATLLTDQYVGRISEGVTLRAGMVFTAMDILTGTGKQTTLTVISGAATDYQCEPGLYTLSQLEHTVNTWLQKAKTDAALNFTWSYRAATSTQSGVRGQFGFEHTAINTDKHWGFICNSAYVLKFMGITLASPYPPGPYAPKTWTWTTPEEPYRLLYENVTGPAVSLTIADSSGTWIDNTGTLPASLRPFPSSSTSQWGVLRLSSGAHLLAHYDSSTVFGAYRSPGLAALGASPWDQFLTDGLKFSDAGDITATQVVMMEGTFADLLTKILASTGVSTYNGSYDALDVQLGCAIPWDLLGTQFTNSLTAIGSQGGGQAMLVVIDKPRKLWDLIKAELLLRRASLVWSGVGGVNGNGGIRVATWATPTATTATWDLTESNKSSPASTVEAQRSVSQLSDEYQYNTLKIEYNRDLAGTYRNSLSIVDRSAVSDGERAITVQCPNSFSAYAATGQAVEELAAQAAAWLPMFARPVRKIRRSIGPEHVCTMTPGDICNVTDNFTRDPSTGIRGLTAIPGLIVSVSYDLGGADPSGGEPRDFVGEVDIVLEPGRRISIYSPCAEVDSTAGTGGYNAGTKVLTLLAHAHSESTRPTDTSNFAIGDKIRIVEIDTDTAGSPDTWTDTIAAVGTNTMTMTSGAGMVLSASQRYRVISDVYTTAVSTQKTDVYQADDADGLISSLAQAYVYSYGTGAATWTATSLSQPVSLYSSYSYGNGQPLDTGHERDVAELVNNLTNYRTAPVGPTLNPAAIVASSATYQRQILHMMPIFIGSGTYSARKRLLSVAPFVRNTIASSKTIYVTLSRFPPLGSSLIWTTLLLPEYTIPSPSVTASFTVGSSAGWAALAAQTLDCRIADPDTGMAYLILEGVKGIETYGYARLDLGPLVSSL